MQNSDIKAKSAKAPRQVKYSHFGVKVKQYEGRQVGLTVILHETNNATANFDAKVDNNRPPDQMSRNK